MISWIKKKNTMIVFFFLFLFFVFSWDEQNSNLYGWDSKTKKKKKWIWERGKKTAFADTWKQLDADFDEKRNAFYTFQIYSAIIIIHVIKSDTKKVELGGIIRLCVCLFEVYGISTFVGNFSQIHFYTNKHLYFK